MNQKWRYWGALLVTLIVVTLLYLPVRSFEFLSWDDHWLVVQNPFLRPLSWENIKTIFLDLSSGTRSILGNEYLPFYDLSFALDAAFHGVNAGGFHISNLILYLSCCALTFWFLTLFSRIWWVVTLATLLFSLHPAHVENVAWISERKSLISQIFLTLAFILLATRAKLDPRPGEKGAALFIATILSFGVAFFSKSTASVFLPLSIAMGGCGIWNAIPLYRRWTAWVGIALITALFMIFPLYVGREIHMIRDWMGGNPLSHWLTIPTLIPRYLLLLFFPWKVNVVTQISPITSFLDPLFLVSILISFALATGAFYFRKRAPFITLSISWFFISLLPVLQIVSIPNRFATRYLLLPSLSLSFLAIGLAEHPMIKKRAKLFATLVLLYSFFFATQIFQLLPLWKNCVTFWNEAERNLGSSLLVIGSQRECLESRGESKKAETLMEEAVVTNPANSGWWNDLGRIQLAQGKLKEAEASFDRAKTNGGEEDAFQNNLALIRLREGKLKEANQILLGIVRSKPRNWRAWSNLGLVAMALGQTKRAEFFFRRSILEGSSTDSPWRNLLAIYRKEPTERRREDLEEFFRDYDRNAVRRRLLGDSL